MTRKFIGVVVLAAAAITGCATSASHGPARGTVLGLTPGTRPIVAGPVTVHAYAAFAGGEIYNAPSATGSPADCARADGKAVALPADTVISVQVPAGELACLRTRDVSGYELLWHAPRPDLGTEPIAEQRVR